MVIDSVRLDLPCLFFSIFALVRTLLLQSVAMKIAWPLAIGQIKCSSGESGLIKLLSDFICQSFR